MTKNQTPDENKQAIIKVVAVMFPLLLCSVLIPWCVWVTSTMFAREVRITAIETFINLGPRTLTSDTVRITNEEKLERVKIIERLDKITLDIQEIKIKLLSGTAK